MLKSVYLLLKNIDSLSTETNELIIAANKEKIRCIDEWVRSIGYNSIMELNPEIKVTPDYLNGVSKTVIKLTMISEQEILFLLRFKE